MESKVFTAYKNLTLAIVNMVNAPRGDTYAIQQRDKYLLKASHRQQLTELAELLVAQQWVVGIFGEVSLRLGADQMAINSQGQRLAQLTQSDVVSCSLEAENVHPLAPAQVEWHRSVYQTTSAEMVALVQPHYTLALAQQQRTPDPSYAAEIFKTIGGIALHSLAELTSETIASIAPTHRAIIVPELGVLLWGSTSDDVVGRAEALEFVSRLTLFSMR